jgi:hypothetical protein
MHLLCPTLGRDSARRVVAAAIDAASGGRETFARALAADAEAAAALGAEGETLDTPERYLGSAESFRRRLLGDERG